VPAYRRQVLSVDVELSNKNHEWQRLPAIEFIIWAFDFIRMYKKRKNSQILDDHYSFRERNSDGVDPVNFLKTVLKDDLELYPTCSAISSTLIFG
jgi:hypothetical protein